MGETVQNTLKGGGTEGRGHKDFKKEGGGASWVSRGGMGALIIKRGVRTPYQLWCVYICFGRVSVFLFCVILFC